MLRARRSPHLAQDIIRHTLSLLKKQLALRAGSRFAENTLRQNLKSVDCFIPPAPARARLCAIAWHAFFAAAIVATLALTLPFASAGPASAQEQAPAVLSLEFNQADGILEIE